MDHRIVCISVFCVTYFFECSTTKRKFYKKSLHKLCASVSDYYLYITDVKCEKDSD